MSSCGESGGSVSSLFLMLSICEQTVLISVDIEVLVQVTKLRAQFGTKGLAKNKLLRPHLC